MALFLGTPKVQFFDNNGVPLSGGKLYTYEPGTTTNKASYPTIADAIAGTNANANPVILDSRGEANVVLQGNTKLKLDQSNDANVWTVDNVQLDGIDVYDANGNKVLGYGATASAVNNIKVTNAATGNPPIVEAEGENNIGVLFRDSNGNEVFHADTVASAINYVKTISSVTGSPPVIESESESDLGLRFNDSNGNELLVMTAVASAVNYINVTNSVTTAAPKVEAAGGDTIIDLEIGGKDPGNIKALTDIDANNKNLLTAKVTATGGDTARTLETMFGDVANVKDYGAVGDGVTDDSSAIQNAVDAGKAIVFFPAGTYKLTDQIEITANVELRGAGEQTIIDASDVSFTGSYVFTAVGSAADSDTISGNPSAGDTSFTTASTTTLSVGDIAIIYNPTNSSWSGYQTYYRAGEFIEIDSASGTTVTLRNPLYDGYTGASVGLDVISPLVVGFSDMVIDADTSTGCLHFDYCRNSFVRNVRMTGTIDSLVLFNRSYKCWITGCDINNVGEGSNDYGVSISNSQHIKISDSYVYSRRHSISHGGGNQVNGVTCRDCRIINCTLKNDRAAATHNFDWHGNCEDCWVYDSRIYGGAIIAGKNNGYRGCYIDNQNNGNIVNGTEQLGGLHIIDNCDMVTYTDPQPNSKAVVDFGNSLTANTAEDITFICTNSTIKSSALGSSTSLFRFAINGCTVKTNVKLDNLILNVNACNNILNTSKSSGTEDCDFIIIDNITQAPTCLFHNAGGNTYRDFPHRLMTQSGMGTGTTDTGFSYLDLGAQSFTYTYPRIPVAFVARSDDTGASLRFLGNRMGVPYINTLTSSAITPGIASDDNTNFSSAVAVGIHWTVGLNEC